VVILAAAPACLTDLGAFVCTSDAACRAGQSCVASACASPDSTCASGLRWDDTAGDRASLCTAENDAAVDPNCGNGVLDDNELCDDGPGSPVPCPTPASCDDGEPCTDDLIVGQACQRSCLHGFRSDGVTCGFDGGITGLCHDHMCCGGCWDGTRCTSGNQPGACGSSGGSCASCAVDGGACQAAYCQTGGCARTNVADQTPCPGGACAAGGCCAGCLQPADGGFACLPGDTTAACGGGGAICVGCANGCATDGGARCTGCAPKCNGKTCGSDGCGGSCGTCATGWTCNNSGTCTCVAATPESGDVLCSDGIDNDCDNLIDCQEASCADSRCAGMAPGRFCTSGSCGTGCRVGSTEIQAPGAVNPSNPCQSCQPAIDDSGWTPLADGTGCVSGGATGTCWSGSCCTGCWNGSSCQNAGTSHCGKSGGKCLDCGDGNPCTTDACTDGSCTNTPVTDGTLCKANLCGNPTMCESCNYGCRIGGSCMAGTCNLLATHTDCCPATTPTCCNIAGGVGCCP
jgi:hypothetical protein